jgi:hypothetical protein
LPRPGESSGLLFFFFSGVMESHHWRISLIQKRFFLGQSVAVHGQVGSQQPRLNFA